MALGLVSSKACHIYHKGHGWLKDVKETSISYNFDRLPSMFKPNLEFMSGVELSFLPVNLSGISSGGEKVYLESFGQSKSKVHWIIGKCDDLRKMKCSISMNLFAPVNLKNSKVWDIAIDKKKIQDGGLWGGSFSARNEMLKYYPIKNPNRSRRGIRREPRESIIKNISKGDILKVIELSKKWSFLSPHTAFIALPDDLQNEFGFQPELRQQKNHLGSHFGVGTPEPAEWALILMMLSIGYWKIKVRQCSLKQN